eukprot:3713926-Rhodomonas_salina.2
MEHGPAGSASGVGCGRCKVATPQRAALTAAAAQRDAEWIRYDTQGTGSWRGWSTTSKEGGDGGGAGVRSTEAQEREAPSRQVWVREWEASRECGTTHRRRRQETTMVRGGERTAED